MSTRFTTRLVRRFAVSGLLGLALATSALAAGSLPRRGVHVPELDMLDDALANYMEMEKINAGLFGVMKDGVIVLQRSYGWADDKLTRPLEPNDLMRVASVTKPITAAAVRILISETDLTLDTPVFRLSKGSTGILAMSPFPSLGDSRLEDITIRNCLQHRGGWDRDEVGDLTYREIEIANAMGLSSPPSRWNTARYILGQPLQFTPGSESAYSNIGYMLLGLVIEQESGMSYLQYIREKIFRPLGVKDCEVILGRTFKSDQDPREPWYDSTQLKWNVFQPWSLVFAAYGGWNHEARISQGRIVTGTTPLLRFLDEYVVNGDEIGTKRSGTESLNWKRNHRGGFAGTSAVVRQRGDGVNFVVIFNQSGHSGAIRDLIDSYLESKWFKWPTESKEHSDIVCRSRPFVRGDCDNSGTVDYADASTLAVSLIYGNSLHCRAAGDANGDGQVDFSDVSHLVSFALAGGPPPVAPYPNCVVGRLPMDDILGCNRSSCSK